MSFVAALPWAVPSAISALGLLLGLKKGDQQTLDPAQQAMMNQALQIQNNRMLLQNPLFEQVTQGAMSRMPRSSVPAQYQLANMQQMGAGEQGGLRTPTKAGVQTGTARRRGSLGASQGTTQALQQLAQYTRQPTSYR